MSSVRRLEWALIYNLVIGSAGWAVLIAAAGQAAQWLAVVPLLMFIALSTVVKRLGFRVMPHIRHSLVGIIDLAALLSFGTLGGSCVAACSAAMNQLFSGRPSLGQPWFRSLSRVLFCSGLNILMMWAAGGVYRALGGSLPLSPVTWSAFPPFLAACLTWFVVDHVGWSMVELIAHGPTGARAFLRAILIPSLLVELLPLPLAPLISAAYLSGNLPLAILTALTILGASLVLHRLMDALAKQALLYRREQKRTAQLMAIGEVTRKVAAILDLQTLFADTVGLVQTTFGYYHVMIFTALPEEQNLVFEASSSPTIQARGVVVSWGKGIIGHAARVGTIHLANDVRHDERFLPDGALEETRAEVAVPLKVEQRVLGILDVQSDRVDAFGEEDLFVLQALADQIAIAVEDSRLFQAQQEQAYVSTALLQVADAVGQIQAPEEVLETIVRLIPLLTGVDLVLVFLWSEDEACFRALEGSGLPRTEMQALQDRRFTEDAIPLLGRVRHENVMIEADLEDLASALFPLLGQQTGMVTAWPLRSKGMVTGALITRDPAGREQLNVHRRAILGGIANQAAMALDNARLYIAQREEVWVSTALLQVANMISTSTDLEETLAVVVRLTPLLIGVDWCAILLWDEQRQVFVSSKAHGLPQSLVASREGHTYSPHQVLLLKRLMDESEPLVIPRIHESDLLPADLAESLPAHSLVALGLRARSNILGALVAGQAQTDRAISGRRMNILAGIANQTALALEADQLYKQGVQQQWLQREIDLARTIQQSFLPERYPELPGWDLAVEWRALRGVGGDYYDFVQLDDRHLGLVIGDVSGKGMGAALYMALARAVMRTTALDRHSAGETLRRVNQFLLEGSRSGMFISIFYGILDLETGLLAYARAGHNPPLLLRHADHALIALDTPGVVLGVVEDVRIAEEQVQIMPGDTLVAYTDGVTEAINEANQEFGEEGLRRVLQQAHHDGAESIVDHIDAAVDQFAGDQMQFDDLTLLVLKRDDAS
jgi:sigma-B regulation protein RsbU (phosphoserine phosphatase)